MVAVQPAAPEPEPGEFVPGECRSGEPESGAAAASRTGEPWLAEPGLAEPPLAEPRPAEPGLTEPGSAAQEDPAWPGITQPAVRRSATDAERRALASVLRLRILRMCLFEPLTNKEIAGRLGMNPASVLHHVRTLAGLGFLQALPERRGTRGAREVPYRATGKSWTLGWDPDPGPNNIVVQAFLDEMRRVPQMLVSSSRLGLMLSAEHHQEFTGRLAALLNEFAARPQDPGGRRWSVFTAVFPDADSPGGPDRDGGQAGRPALQGGRDPGGQGAPGVGSGESGGRSDSRASG